MLPAITLLLATSLPSAMPSGMRPFHDLSIGFCMAEQARLDPQASQETLMQRCLTSKTIQAG
ncbi:MULTISPECIES: hypothetical protein [unclassified Paludibacterium]|uniref:hypothetical protein n=1 Tax=unclassified Paludibacterium TaxID=2618429 RepID=UPI001C03D007|nr:hypothetical protein [Paludibacterium sp. B53371]